MKPIDRLRAKVFPRGTVVRSLQPLGERLVVLPADQPVPVMLAPGDVIAVRITSKGFGPTGTGRRYTVSSSTAATFDIVAFRTETGPATPFLDSLTVGASLVVRGPEAPVPPPRATTGLLAVVGDESAIGTVRALASTTSARVTAGLQMSCSTIDPSTLFGSATCLVLADADAMSAWIDSVARRTNGSA